MMKRILSTFMLLITLAVSVTAADRYSVYRIDGCTDRNNCEARIQNCLKNMKGVSNVQYLPSRNSVVVTFDPSKTSDEAICRKFGKAGIQATHCRPERPQASEVERGYCQQQSLRPSVSRNAVKANGSCRNASAAPLTKACARVDSSCQSAGDCRGNAMCGKGRHARRAVRK